MNTLKKHTQPTETMNTLNKLTQQIETMNMLNKHTQAGWNYEYVE